MKKLDEGTFGSEVPQKILADILNKYPELSHKVGRLYNQARNLAFDVRNCEHKERLLIMIRDHYIDVVNNKPWPQEVKSFFLNCMYIEFQKVKDHAD